MTGNIDLTSSGSLPSTPDSPAIGQPIAPCNSAGRHYDSSITPSVTINMEKLLRIVARMERRVLPSVVDQEPALPPALSNSLSTLTVKGMTLEIMDDDPGPSQSSTTPPLASAQPISQPMPSQPPVEKPAPAVTRTSVDSTPAAALPTPPTSAPETPPAAAVISTPAPASNTPPKPVLDSPAPRPGRAWIKWAALAFVTSLAIVGGVLAICYAKSVRSVVNFIKSRA